MLGPHTNHKEWIKSVRYEAFEEEEEIDNINLAICQHYHHKPKTGQPMINIMKLK
uniref:Uncharacterized protein n=1 Tax=Arion vulgaris TaxID=1028688 RepID=A0A0B6Z7D8_9EUPU